MLQIGGKEFNIIEDLIVEIIGLLTDGKKFYRDKNEFGLTMDTFFKDDEMNKLERGKYVGYYRSSLKTIWRDVSKEIMRYFTLNGLFSYL